MSRAKLEALLLSQDTPPRRRKVMFYAKALLVGALVAIGVSYCGQRFGVLHDPQLDRSLGETSVWFWDRHDRAVVRGEVYVFQSVDLEPLIPDGRLIAKRVIGIGGDTVEVNEDGVHVNGQKITSSLFHAQTLGKDESAFFRKLILKEGEVFLIGDSVKSFDSRYWGPISDRRMLGKARPVM